MIFELDNVELYFKNKRILNGIYLKAETGTVTGILGRNGSGKSCLMEIAFGNLKPKYKLVRLDKQPVLKPLYTTKKVKYLPQYNFVLPSLRLAKVFALFKVSWKDFISDFSEFQNRQSLKFGKLSGGERRLIETYLILMSNAELILLDEPFSHLAPLHIETFKTLIMREKVSKAIVISDHMYRHIVDISDHIYLLKNGCTKLINDLNELEDYKYLNEGTLV